MKTLSIRTKLILLTTVMSTVIIAGILSAISGILSRAMEREVVADFQETQYFFKRQDSLIYDRLVESCLLIGQNSAFKANVALEDPPSVMQAVEEFAGFTKVDLFVVSGNDGAVLAWLDKPLATGRDISDRPGMAASLAGVEPGWELEEAVLWEVDRQLYRVISVPIFAGGGQLGVITLGTRFTDFEATFLKGKSDIDISLFLGKQLVGTSIRGVDGSDKAEALRRFLDTYGEIVDGHLAQADSSRVFPARFAGAEVFAFAGSLGRGANGYYLAMAQKSKELLLLRQISRRIFLVGAAGFFLSAILALLLGQRFGRPILRLVDGMERVRAGDLEVDLPVRGRDEFARLTEAFNAMIKRLQERLFLMKYVGGHTLDMIRSEDKAWLTSRGKRMEVAVLFSDIRGFTAYSEIKEPEEVIEVLNAWLGFQAELVRRHEGFVDKYVGDEMVALFTGAGGLQRAFACAQAIQRQSARLSDHPAEPVSIGIGINWGPAVMGNVGNESRLDYTVIGASVNLGARLCAAAHAGEILLTEEMAGRLGPITEWPPSEDLQLKGLSQSQRVIRFRVPFQESERSQTS